MYIPTFHPKGVTSWVGRLSGGTILFPLCYAVRVGLGVLNYYVLYGNITSCSPKGPFRKWNRKSFGGFPTFREIAYHPHNKQVFKEEHNSGKVSALFSLIVEVYDRVYFSDQCFKPKYSESNVWHFLITFNKYSKIQTKLYSPLLFCVLRRKPNSKDECFLRIINEKKISMFYCLIT